MIKLIEVRHNANLTIDVSDHKFKPNTEIIIVGIEPVYSVLEDKIVRTNVIKDVRFHVDLDGIEVLINTLKTLQSNMKEFSKLSNDVNKKITITK